MLFFIDFYRKLLKMTVKSKKGAFGLSKKSKSVEFLAKKLYSYITEALFGAVFNGKNALHLLYP